MYFKKLLLHSLLFCTVIVCSYETEDTDVVEYCNKLRGNRRLLLVSTLDGKLTALSVVDGGTLKWSVPTEPGPLLSSTIHNMEVAEKYQVVRIIPSLSGGLYKFDGESIEPMPVNTDSLLHSYWDGVDVSGGKEVRSYAIDIESGNVLYECSMNECSNWTETAYLNSDLLLLRRETQKVRAVELQTRTERWNYSVGLHNLTVSHNAIPECSNQRGPFDYLIRAVVPKGLLFVSNKSRPDDTEWQYEFDSPIVNVWTLIGSQLEWVDLFKPIKTVSKKQTIYPTLYIGVHDEQLYIQESEPMHRKQSFFEKPRLSMKKYHLIQAFDIANKQNVVPLITDERERNSSTALAMLYDGGEYVKGQGYYLYCADAHDCQARKNTFVVLSAVFLSSFLYWWKELIGVLAMFLIFFFIPCPNITTFSIAEAVKAMYANIRRIRRPSVREPVEVEATTSKFESTPERRFLRTSSESETGSFHSRYLDDFEPIHCLGKGGFGVVFQARHKVDDCHYAIKRITLPNKEEARERVMREVKALAKMEHQYIVRYFQSWQEKPPPGWQEEQDKLWRDKTRDDYLSSEPDGGSEVSVTSSFSIVNKCVHSKLGVNVANHESEIGKSDSFEIEFKNSASQLLKTSTDDEVHTLSTKTASYIHSRVNHSRKKSVSRGPKCSRVYLYIQMQLCQRNSLREWLCDNLERDTNVVLNMFYQIIQAVEYVHMQGLIHRDLKPSNIFFAQDGHIKVGDFGLVAEIIEDNDLIYETKGKPALDETHTANVGTTLYMSPEQSHGDPYNYKVDIYSLGIILFELLTPFSTDMERFKTLTDLRNNKFPNDFNAKYQDEFQLLAMMLSTSPEERPTTYGIRYRPPFSKLRPPNVDIPSEWHFDLPPKNCVTSNKLRKSSTENVS